ncbi:MAG: hypothetical protein WC998_04560 [Candidatus Paceibacterota bacterium]|jgi:hypothetical protein
MSNETLNIILTAVIVPLLVALTPLLINFISLKAKEVNDKIGDARLKKYVDIADDAIETAVVSVMQTYVDALKGTNGWTSETQRKAFEDAKIKALIIMGTAAKEAIAAAYGDVNTWIDDSIQYYVNMHKAA